MGFNPRNPSRGSQEAEDRLRWLSGPWSWYMRLTEKKRLKQYEAESAFLMGLEDELSALSDATLSSRLSALSTLVRLTVSHQSFAHRPQLLNALAMVGEVAWRQLQMRPYAVQWQAVLAMLDGQVVQVAPGEGKTLTIAITAIFYAFLRQPCHVMTSNSYLAQRDADLMRPLFEGCGLSVDALDDTRKGDSSVYAHPVVYGTAQQFLADYLRDRLALGRPMNRLDMALADLKHEGIRLTTRGLGTAIVDEADSVLVDEANTPLIISGAKPDPLLEQAVITAHDLVNSLKRDVDYRASDSTRTVHFSEACWLRLMERVEEMPAPWRHPQRFEHALKQAVLAKDIYRVNEHYIVADEKVVIVDERTGRQMPNRNWGQGLHQAIEYAAGVPMTDPTETRERMSFQNFFCLYRRVVGASGTLQNLDLELALVYGVSIQRVPNRLPPKCRHHPLQLFSTQREKFEALTERVVELHRNKRPVLIGTRRIEDSENLTQRMLAKGLAPRVLNAKNPADEAAIIAEAGRLGQVTVATNMAGRGVDIAVGSDVESAGGLVVILTEPHSAKRIDQQLYGRSARQGQAGETWTYVSLDDALLKEHLPQVGRLFLKRIASNSESGQRLIRWGLGCAQALAQQKALRQRQQLNRSDRKWRDALSFTTKMH